MSLPRAGWRPWVALAVFSAAAVLLTYPVAWSLDEGLAGDGADANLFVWNHWWLAEALSEGESPYHTDMVFWPTGTSLVLHTFSPYHGVLSLALAPWLGQVAAYNVLVLLSFALAGWAGYLAVREITGSEAGGYVAGFAFGFAGYHYAHALGHLNLIAYHWLALFLLFFVRWIRHDRRRDALFAALMIVGAGLTDYAMMLTLALFAIVFSLAWHGFRHRAAYERVLWVGLLGAILFAPWVVMVIMEYSRSPELISFSMEAQRYSLDVFSYVVPTEFSTLYEDVGRVLPQNGTATEATVFLGYVILALAAYALWRFPWSRTRPWVLTSAVFYVLSLGPRLQVMGRPTGIPLPYEVFLWTPLLNTLRTPARFALVVLLCFTVLAAMAVADLLARWAERRPAPARLSRIAAPVAVALLCSLVVAETVVVPFPVTPLRYSPLYDEAKAMDTLAIVDLPLHQPGYAGQLGRVNYMAAQTIHEMPMVNGYNARQTTRDTQTIQAQQVLSLLHRQELDLLPIEKGDILPQQDAREVAGDLLAARGMRALLLHRSDPPTAAEAREMDFLSTLNGVRLVKEAGDAALYEAVPSANPPPLLLDLGKGWHGVELSGETPSRWTFQTAQILIDAARPMNVTLSFNVSSFLAGRMDARAMSLIVEGGVVLEREVGRETIQVSVNVSLAEGTNYVTLHSEERATTPREAKVSWDSRPLAFAVQDVRVTPRDP